MRGSWAYELAQRFGPHGYLNAALYYHPGKYRDNLTRLANDVASSPETYIDHKATFRANLPSLNSGPWFTSSERRV